MSQKQYDEQDLKLQHDADELVRKRSEEVFDDFVKRTERKQRVKEADKLFDDLINILSQLKNDRYWAIVITQLEISYSVFSTYCKDNME